VQELGEAAWFLIHSTAASEEDEKKEMNLKKGTLPLRTDEIGGTSQKGEGGQPFPKSGGDLKGGSSNSGELSRTAAPLRKSKGGSSGSLNVEMRSGEKMVEHISIKSSLSSLLVEIKARKSKSYHLHRRGVKKSNAWGEVRAAPGFSPNRAARGVVERSRPPFSSQPANVPKNLRKDFAKGRPSSASQKVSPPRLLSEGQEAYKNNSKESGGRVARRPGLFGFGGPGATLYKR